MAVRDHLGAGRRADERTDGLRITGGEQPREIDVAGTGDPAGSWVARSDDVSGELVGSPDIQEHELRVVQASRELGERDVAHAASDATVSISAAIEGRTAHASIQRRSAG